MAIQPYLELLFFSVSVGQFCLVSSMQAVLAKKTDEFILFKSFSDLPSAGHTNGAGKPVIEFRCRGSGLLSRQSPVRFPLHRQRAELRGNAANQHFN